LCLFLNIEFLLNLSPIFLQNKAPLANQIARAVKIHAANLHVLKLRFYINIEYKKFSKISQRFQK